MDLLKQVTVIMVLFHVGHSSSQSHPDHVYSTNTTPIADTSILPSYLLKNPHLVPFLLSFIASMGTFLGGLLTILLVKLLPNTSTSTSNNLLGILQAFSAGVMLYMTFIDLMPEARESLGSYESNIWFFVGVIVFGILEAMIIPAAESMESSPTINGHSHTTPHEDHNQQSELESHNHIIEKQKSKSTPKKRKRGNTSTATPKSSYKSTGSISKSTLLRTSLVTFIAMGLHNLPEGLSVYLGALANFRLGLQLAAAICLHNIPEGMAVAIPLWAATKSTCHVILMTFINGLMEPLGVILGGYILGSYLNHEVLSRSLAAVAGIMACISMHELFPTAIQYAGKERASIALFAGMLVCFGALEGVHLIMETAM